MSTVHPIRFLEDYVIGATTVFRKGEVVTYSETPNLAVWVIDDFPSMPKGLTTTVDCHFVDVGFTEALAGWDHQQFYDAVIAAEDGLYAAMDVETWRQGPSYITIGAWIGDQTTAFRFMACVQAHGLGHVITPATLGVTDKAAADNMAGGGMVLLSGLKNPSEVTAGG